MASNTVEIPTDLAQHLRNTLDGRWHDVKNRCREQLAGEVFRPHYTPTTVIARTRALEQLKIIAAAGAAEDGFRKEHGGTATSDAAVTTIEMLAMSDVSLMVKAGVQWGLFGGAIENLGTERHHEAYVQKIIDLDLLGCFAMTETGHGSDVQSLETTATYDGDTDEFVINSPTRTSRKDYIGGAAETARMAAVFAQLITAGPGQKATATECTASSCRFATTRATTCPASPRPIATTRADCPVWTTAASCSTTSGSRGITCSTSTATWPTTARTRRRSKTRAGGSSRCWAR